MGTISKSQVAIGNYHYVAYSFDYFLNSVKSIGAENIELWGAKPHFCVDDQNRESVREFRKRVEDKGLSLICFCRLPRYLTKPRQRRSEWDMAGSDGISRVSAVFRGKSLLTNKMRII